MKINKTEIRKVFANNTEKQEVHVTSDGNKFFERSHAITHGKNLADPAVTTIKRSEAEADETDEEALESIRSRREQLMAILEQYKPEWEELDRKEKEILDRMDSGNAGSGDQESGDQESGDQGTGSQKSGANGTEGSSGDAGTEPGAEGSGKPSGKNKSNKAK